MKNMLLLSSSKYKNTGYLEHTIPWLQNFLADYRGKTIAFVPYAGVRRTFDEYEKSAKCTFWFRDGYCFRSSW